MAPHLTGNDAEDFADAFAGTLLFPEEDAQLAYAEISQLRNKGGQVNKLKDVATRYVISPITVYKQINEFCRHYDLQELELGNGIYGAAANLNKQLKHLGSNIFEAAPPRADEYVAVSSRDFGSPFFDILKAYFSDHGANTGFVQSILKLPLLDSKALLAELVDGE